MMDFDRPLLLLLFPPAALLLWWGWRKSIAQWTARQSALCLVVRTAIAAALCLALAGPRWITQTNETAVVILRDVSASVSPEAREQGKVFAAGAAHGKQNRVAEVVFARAPVTNRPFGESGDSPSSVLPAEDGTDLSGALEYAAAILPADRPGRIVLLSDGIVTAGNNPLEAASSLAAQGIEIDTQPLSSPHRPEVAVVSLKAPGLVREGEVFDLSANIHTSAAASAVSLRLYQNNLLISERKQDLPAGMSQVVFPSIKAEDRTALYEVEISTPDDTHAENNRRKMAMAHGGPASVLLIDRNPSQSEPLANALRATDFSVDIRPPQGFPSEIEALEAFDLVIFTDAPAADFSDGQMKLLDEWVKNFGGGFLMIGGEESFGAGGYFRTPLATLLPVRIERQEREETPVVALLVILDRSGSMSAPVGGQTKMTLANEGAALALEVLQQKDLFGVFAVDTRVQDIVPLGKIGDKEATARRIAGITSGGGGIYVYTSLAEAFPRLRDAQAKIKHIILFSDAADAEEKIPGSMGDSPTRAGGTSALDLAAAMLASRITLSVVALGSEQDRDTAFLRQLAAQGGGRFYLTPDAKALPRLFTLETMRASESSLREDAFFARPVGESTILQGINWAEAPLLLGLNLAQIKPGAELVLRSEKGEPLLAMWRYGLGHAAAFTSDAKARWASEWLAWPGYAKLWAQTARALVRSGERRDLVLDVREEGGNLVVDAEAVTPEGSFRNGLGITVSMAAQGNTPVTTQAAQVAPGLYRAILKTPDAESAMIAVSDAGARPVPATWTRDYPAEYRVAGDGEPLLKKLSAVTSGKFQPTAEEIFRPALRPARTRRDLAPFLLALAVLLWPVDVWLRRRDWNSIRGKSLPPFSHAR